MVVVEVNGAIIAHSQNRQVPDWGLPVFECWVLSYFSPRRRYTVSVKPSHDLHLRSQYVPIVPYSSRSYMQLADTIRDTGCFHGKRAANAQRIE